MTEEQKKTPSELSLPGISEEEKTELNLKPRLERYRKAHDRALEMHSYIEDISEGNIFRKKEFSGISSSLRSCGEFLLFRNYYTVKETRLINANFCRNHLLCPLCAIRRASKTTKAYMDRLEVLQSNDGAIKPFFVTLTIQNGSSLQDCFNHIKRAHAEMIDKRRDAARGRRNPLEINKALGGLYTYEIKRGANSGLWHVHIHSVWLCKETPWETRLSEEWKEITGDSFIVDVRPITDEKGFIEVLSYAVKFSTMSIEDNFDAFKILRKKRLLNSFGVFRSVEVPDELEDQPLEDLPYVELLFAYIPGSGYRRQLKHEISRDKINAQINAQVPF